MDVARNNDIKMEGGEEGKMEGRVFFFKCNNYNKFLTIVSNTKLL